MATRELFIVPERFGHHVVESSPDQLLAHIEPFSPYEGRYGTMADLPAHLAEKAGARPNIRTAYGERAFCRELSLMEEMGGRRDMLVHFLNGESAVCLTPRAKGENRIVATYHQPAAFMETIIPDKSHFPLHDAVVVVSANQLEYFEKITGKGRVRHIPLGVETGFFPFGAPEGRVKRVLFVGNWLRDFDLLDAVMRRLGKTAPDIERMCVTPAGNHDRLAASGARLTTGLSTSELAALYASSSVFLLPVADCTANTALLEAMACGTPVAANARALAAGYLDEDMSLVTPDGDADALAASCVRLCRDEGLRRRMSEASRQRASDVFDWSRVAPLHAALYAELGADVRAF